MSSLEIVIDIIDNGYQQYTNSDINEICYCFDNNSCIIMYLIDEFFAIIVRNPRILWNEGSEPRLKCSSMIMMMRHELGQN